MNHTPSYDHQEYGQTLMEKWEKKLEAALKARDHKLRDLEEEVASLAQKLQAAVESVEAVEKTNRLPVQGELAFLSSGAG